MAARWSALFFLLLFFKLSPAQVIVGNYGITYVFAAPTGTCSSSAVIQVVVGSGAVYSCQSGSWAQIGGSSGGAVLPFPGIVFATSGSAGRISTSSDIISLWSGTCSASTFLQGAGACSSVNLSSQVSSNLPVGNGGTATATAPSAGQILVAQSTSSYSPVTMSGNCTISTAGVVSCTGGGAVSSVSNSDGTLTISPTTGSVVASLNLAHANTWTAAQTFSTVTVNQITVSGSTPTIAVGAAAGTGATASITGTNTAGVITLNTGTATSGAGILFTVTFNGTLTPAPQGCSLMSRNSSAAGNVGMIFTTAPSTTSWTATEAISPAAVSSTFQWSYLCV